MRAAFAIAQLLTTLSLLLTSCTTAALPGGATPASSFPKIPAHIPRNAIAQPQPQPHRRRQHDARILNGGSSSVGLYTANPATPVQQAQTACDASSLTLPSDPSASPPLPPPTGKLAYVAVGRGVQLYSCATSPDSASSTPAPAGAVAALFDATCLAAKDDSIVQYLPVIALQFPTPPVNTSSKAQLVGMPLLGRHYFTGTGSTSVPTFNLHNGARGDSGFLAAKVAIKTPAPSGTVEGRNGRGYGSVDWLQLGAKPGVESTFRGVYRVNTAGGKPPKTCEGVRGKFEVEYAAEYWFYS